MQRHRTGEPVRTVIVDDEPLARAQLRVLAEAHDVEVVSECGCGREAVETLRHTAPELVFLDVRMPGLSGFDVVNEIGPEHMPIVVFVTAYDEHALQAFEARALDYLLKPIDEQRFVQATQRAIDEARARRTLGRITEQDRKEGQRLIVKTMGRRVILEPGLIDWVEAADYCVRVHASGQSYLWRESLSGVEARLAEHPFVRIHRSALVNVLSIREIQRRAHGDARVILRNGTAIPLSRSRRPALEEAIRKRSVLSPRDSA